ncbi:uncharacterized protein LOC105848048 isoform X1 [Hydra vulgaris]|uniref:uncharacterized protein LOC105848048 isoform X1 n=1 Tax=Hydra vulgaris TaxID=6087 RepID=UPI001F5FDCF8|nr:uncharacterized protein LOC105848048 [Hydra vulgaris]
MAVPADESFEDFFNCETLSDRILYIVEVEECPNSYSNHKSSHSELFRKEKKNQFCSEESISSEPKRAKISPTINNIEYEDDDTVDKEIFEFTDTLSEQENLEEQDAPLITIKQEECTEIGSVVLTNAASPFVVKNLELNIEPEFSVDDMIKSVNQSSEVTLQVLHKTMSGDMPLASGLQTPKQVNLFASRSSPCYVHSSVKTELIHDSNTECSLKPSKIEQPKSKRIIKETKVYVHSVILAAKSEFFKLLLSTSGMKETKEKDVRIEVDKDETENMMILLHCFYNKKTLDEHKLGTIFRVCSLAMKYCFDGLIDKCLDIYRLRAESSITDVEDINQIASMVSKIQTELQQHKDKCLKVMKSCWPLLLKSFYPLDECLEKTPLKFFQLHLQSMYWFLEPNVQARFNNDHGNLFVYAMQRWLKAHASFLSNEVFKNEIILFVEKLLNTVKLTDLTGDFLTNVMTYELSPFNIWPGYKNWYIKALQTFVYRYHSNGSTINEKPFPIIKRVRNLKFIRRENNTTDIFALRTPVILNGFEIGIYFRLGDDRRMYVICKCKNISINRAGFDKCSLTFNLQGTLKLHSHDNMFIEKFPSTCSQWLHEWFTFSYKQSSMCLQMYAVCKLSPAVYCLSKQTGFLCTFQMQQLK